MQDIDFDEIDRAVSSVTNPTAKKSAPIVVPEFSVAPRPIIAPDETPAPASIPAPTSTPTPTSASAPTSVVEPSLASRRSSGRFMDVVHPSSDMRPSGTRPHLDIAPSPAFQREQTARDEQVRKEPVREAPKESPAPVPSDDSAFSWPDPIDLDESLLPSPDYEVPVAPAPVVSAPVVETIPESVVPVPEDIPTPLVPEPAVDPIDDLLDTPLESPFLPDTKVEKRPLGAFSGADADLPLLEDFPLPDQASENAAPTTTVSETPAEPVDDAQADAHLDELMLEAHYEEEPATQPESAPEIAPESSPAPVVEDIPVGPTSITQQYQEKPSSATEASGSIFDTEAYHKPLAHTAKKHSGVLTIVWIFALILVGGGIGAAIYFVVLPMIG